MEHKTILGGEQYLGLARSRIKALRLAGLEHATKIVVLPDATITVRISPQADYIRIEGGNLGWTVGIEANRITVRTKSAERGDWRIHSEFADAYSDPLDIIPFQRLSNRHFATLSKRSTDVPGSDASSTLYRFVDGFGTGRRIYDGTSAPYLGGLFWGGFPAWVISTDGDGGCYLFSAVEDTTGGTHDNASITWKCEQIPFGSSGLVNVKPAMWNFTYDPSAHSGRGLHTLMTENVVYLGDGRFCYGLGGSSYSDGTRDSDHKMAIIVTDNFDTFAAYDVESGIGIVYGTDDFALGSGCYIGDGTVMFSGYGTTDVIVFVADTGAMYSAATPTPPVGWSTTLAAIMPLGDLSAAYWEYEPGMTSLNLDANFVYTTDAGNTWTSKPISTFDSDGTTPLAVELYLGTTTIRHPLVQPVPYSITSMGEIAAVFHVAGVGHVEFRTKDLGDTWVKFGVISPVAADGSGIGLLYRHVLFGAPDLPLQWN